MGRPRKPTAFRVIEGVSKGGRSAVAHRSIPLDEPTPRWVMPRRPASLTGEARLEWDRQAPRLHAMRVLTEVDGSILTMYCQNWKRWLQAEAAVERTLEATGRLSRMRVLVALRYAAIVLQLAGQLGLSPSARARMATGDRGEIDDGLGILS